MLGNEKHAGTSESHERAAEMHDGAARAHIVASASHESQDHLTAHENSRHSLENSQVAQGHSRHASGVPGESRIAAAAHFLWEDRGKPAGSQNQDWYDAVRDLREEQAPQMIYGQGGVRKNV